MSFFFIKMGNCRDAPIDQCDQPWLVTCRSLRDLRFCSNHTHRNRHSAVSVYLLHLVLFAEVQILPFTSSWRFEKRERNRTCKTLLQFIITWKKSYKNVCVLSITVIGNKENLSCPQLESAGRTSKTSDSAKNIAVCFGCFACRIQRHAWTISGFISVWTLERVSRKVSNS